MEGAEPFVAGLPAEAIPAGDATSVIPAFLTVAAHVLARTFLAGFTTFTIAAEAAAPVIATLFAEANWLTGTGAVNAHHLIPFARTTHIATAIRTALLPVALRLANAEALDTLLVVQAIGTDTATAVIAAFSVATRRLADTDSGNAAFEVSGARTALTLATIIPTLLLTAIGSALAANIGAVARPLCITWVLLTVAI